MKKFRALLICGIFFAAYLIAAEPVVINIYSYNTTLQDVIEKVFPNHPDFKINYIIQSINDSLPYDQAVEKALINNTVDIFIAEPEYCARYADSNLTMDLINELGLTETDIKNQFEYTKAVGTSKNGQLKGMAWQASPAGFLYRRSIAKQVFGTDDPAVIQEKISTWDKYLTVALKLRKQGVYMHSTIDESFKAFQQASSTPWVVDNTLMIDDSVNRWFDFTQFCLKNDLCKSDFIWSPNYFNEFSQTKVFGYFAAEWLMDYLIAPAAYNSYGDWAFCKGPQGFFWGGVWIFVAKNTKHADICKRILYELTCSTKTMTSILKSDPQMVNNYEVMNDAAHLSFYSKPLLGNKNISAELIECAEDIKYSGSTPYDSVISEIYVSTMRDLFLYDITISREAANAIFVQRVLERFPYLKTN